MKYTKTIIIPIITLLLSSNLSLTGQTYFSEDFESGTTPLNWSNQFIEGSTLWRYAYGGYRTVDYAKAGAVMTLIFLSIEILILYLFYGIK